MKEVFREVADFPGYLIGHLGTPLKRFKNGREVRLKTRDDNGYRAVALWKQGKRKVLYVHRLVLLTFVGPCPEGMEGMHGNGKRADNRLSNLSWGTPKQNAEARKRHGTTLQGEKSPNAKLTASQVKRFLEGKYGDRKTAAGRLGVHPRTLAKIEAGESWAHLGRG